MEERSPIRLGLFRFFLRFIKVKPETAWVELREDSVFIQFGYIHAEIPYANIAGTEVRRWPGRYGFGLRIAPNRTMGYVGAGGDALWIRLREPQSVKAGPGTMQLERDNLAISVDDPAGLARALEGRTQVDY